MHIDILPSSIWQTNATLLSHNGEALLIDPGYFPAEISAIAERVKTAGHLKGIIFTHGHWDHVMGHAAFPGTPVWVSDVLEAAITTGDAIASRSVERAREFDSRWYVPRLTGYDWPSDRRGVADGDLLDVGGIVIRALHVPGHSPDGLALHIEQGELLIVGDHLSPCEIPFVDDIHAYQATLARLTDRLRGGVRVVIPGHGRALDAAEAMAIARADAEYLGRLLDAAARQDIGAALAIPLPRAADVVGMRDAHLKNCGKAGLVFADGSG